MSKKSRKMKWKGVALNHSNIDEYMKDLIEDTAGQYITQGVSFNKEDNFQMNLLKNSILAHGSFSGFVKNLLFAYFEKNGSIDDSVWQPNAISEIEESSSQQSTSPSPTPVVSPEPVTKEDDEQHDESNQDEDIQDEQHDEDNQDNQDSQDGQVEDDDETNKEPIAEDENLKNESPAPVVKPTIVKRTNKEKRKSPNATAFLPKK